MTTAFKTIEVKTFTENIKSVSLGKSLLWHATGVNLRCSANNLTAENGRRLVTLQMIANGYIVASVDVLFRTRAALAECVELANITGHFEPRCGTYRIL